MPRPTQRLLLLVVLLLSAYVGSYVLLSRRAFAEADYYGMKGFYFTLPVDEQANTLNHSLVLAYCPCILVDYWIGTGRPPGADPMLGLSK